MTRTSAVALGAGITALVAALPAAAQDATGQQAIGSSARAVSVAQTDPMVFGLGLAGLCWLVAGLLALAVGIVLATRRAGRPVLDGSAGTRTTTTTSTSNTRAGGVQK